MRNYFLYFFGFFLTLTAFTEISKSETQIPNFIPNVVDASGFLLPNEKQELNALIQELEKQVDILAAVYIIEKLHGETIEQLAVRAFNQWQLGEKKKDNGLLLVLAIKDRRMRFEVGYGLEGDLPDVIAREALDEYLRPFLRKNQMLVGIKSALRFLAEKKNPNFVTSEGNDIATMHRPKTAAALTKINQAKDFFYSLMTVEGSSAFIKRHKIVLSKILLIFLTCFFIDTLLEIFLNRKKKRLLSLHPDFEKQIKIMNINFFAYIPFKIVMTFFMSVFVFLLPTIFGLICIFMVLIALIFVFLKNARIYNSVESFKLHLKMEEERINKLVEDGMAIRNENGGYTFTDKYHSLQRSKSRSSSSSSSRGGSSGGGGSSSSW